MFFTEGPNALVVDLLLAVGTAQSIWLLTGLRRRRGKALKAYGTPPSGQEADQLAGCSLRVRYGRQMLLGFRAFAAILGVLAGVFQIWRDGAKVLRFYTVLTWWMQTLFFALAASVSVSRRRQRRRRSSPCSGEAQSTAAPDWMSEPLAHVRWRRHKRLAGRRQSWSAALPIAAQVAVVLYHVVTTAAVIVASLNWCLLYPVQLGVAATAPDPQAATEAVRAEFFQPLGLLQHGGNAVLALVELRLNALELQFGLLGACGLWAMAYGWWSVAWHSLTGRWLYPFLDTTKPSAPWAYLGIYLAHTTVYATLHQLSAALKGPSGGWRTAPAPDTEQPLVAVAVPTRSSTSCNWCGGDSGGGGGRYSGGGEAEACSECRSAVGAAC